MAELTAPDGTAVEAEKADVERRFDAAMAADGSEPAAPPKRAPAADEPKPRRGRPPKAERARVTAGTTAPAGLSDEQRADGVKGLVQIGAGLCLVANRATGSDGFKADAITLASSADDWASACVQVAKADEKFARIIDKVAGAGPYGALITVAMATGMQLVRNHKPGASLPGTTDPAKLIKAAEAQAEPEPVAA